MEKKRILPFLIIFLTIFVFSLPFFIKPEMILERGNDLEEFFWPILYYVKNHILSDRVIPLWNNFILSGTPLVTDPQAPIFYPLNFFSLILPINIFFLGSFFIHYLIAGFGMYLCAKKGFSFSKTTSIFIAISYSLSPKFVGYLEAGHVGLIYSIAWIPFAILATIKMSQKPNLKTTILLAISLALLYYSHIPTFVIVVFSLTLLYIYLRGKLLFLLVAGIITFGLVAISLIPQLGWQKESTRYILLRDKDVYPKWTSVLEPIKLTFVPWIRGIPELQAIDTEKWIPLGIGLGFMVLMGLFRLKKKQITVLILFGFLIMLLILNNASPISSILLKQNWYLLIRVSTRFWIVFFIIALFLAGLGFEKLLKTKKKLFPYLVFFLILAESLFLGWTFINKLPGKYQGYAPKEVSDYLSSDKSIFRVFCTTRCLSQKDAAIHNLQLLDGYNTIQQKNFNQQAWQLTGTYWNYYTLSIPPMGAYLNGLVKPDLKSLGKYSVKYIISPVELNNKNLIFKKRIDNFYIYENELFLPRTIIVSHNKGFTNSEVVTYKPNYIKINIVSNNASQLILSEVYSPGWQAYLNGNEKIIIQETPEALRAIDLKQSTRYVELKYELENYRLGKIITFATLSILIANLIFKWKIIT